LSIRSHPSAALLAEYAAGQMAFAPSLTVSAHTEVCARCAARLREWEEAEGHLLAATPRAPVSQDVLEKLLARLDDPPQDDGEGLIDRLGDVQLPSDVARAGLGPRRWLAPGLWSARVRAPEQDGWRTILLRTPAGVTIPTHRHEGQELVCVLAGAFDDRRRYHAGDFGENVAGSSHQLKVTADGPCACLIAVRGAISWRGLSKIITPALGF